MADQMAQPATTRMAKKKKKKKKKKKIKKVKTTASGLVQAPNYGRGQIPRATQFKITSASDQALEEGKTAPVGVPWAWLCRTT